MIVVSRLANFEDEKSTKINEKKNDQSSLAAYVYSLLDKRLTWEDIKWLKRFEIQYIYYKSHFMNANSEGKKIVVFGVKICYLFICST